MELDDSQEPDPASPRLEITVLRRPDAGEVDSRFVADFVRGVARVAGADSGEVAVVLAGDPEVRALNRDYRGQDRVTDILSFPGEATSGRRGVSGDLIIAVGKARRQAVQRHHSLDTELRYLLIHGLLHLLGFDHEADQGEMEAEERHLRGLLLPSRRRERTHRVGTEP